MARVNDLDEFSFVIPREGPATSIGISINEPSAPSLDTDPSVPAPANFSITLKIMGFLEVYKLLSYKYTHLSVAVKSRYDADDSLPLPSGADFSTFVNTIYTYTANQASTSADEEIATDPSQLLFFKEYNLTEFIPSSNVDATTITSTPATTISYQAIDSESTFGEIIPHEAEKSKKIILGGESSVSSCQQLILNSSDSFSDLNACKFPANLDDKRASVHNLPSAIDHINIGSEDKSSEFWKFWKQMYQFNNREGFLVKTKDITQTGPMPDRIYLRVENNSLESSEDIVFTLEDIIEILSLSHDIYIRVYRDPSLPWVNSASYAKQFRLSNVSLMDFAAIGLASHSIMEPCKISIDAATEFLDSASVTNPSKNTRMIRILEKYYDTSVAKIKNGNSALFKINPLEEKRVDMGYNQRHTIRWYEAYEWSYITTRRGNTEAVITPLQVTRTKPTPQQINNSRSPFAYCYYTGGNISIIANDFPPDTEQYKIYLDKSNQYCTRPIGRSRKKFEYLTCMNINLERTNPSNFTHSFPYANLPPGGYRIVIDAYKNGCVVQSYDSVFSVRSGILEQQDASFTLSISSSPGEDVINITETSTAESISSIILETANPLFSEFFSEGYAKTAPTSQIATAYKIYRLDKNNGAYEDVTPGSTGYVAAGAYTVAPPPLGDDEIKDVVYFVDQYATYAGNLTIDNFPLADSARLGTEKYYYDHFKWKSPERFRKDTIPALHNMSTSDRANYQYNSFLQHSYVSTKTAASVGSSEPRRPTIRMAVQPILSFLNRIYIQDFNESEFFHVDQIMITARAAGYKSVIACIPAPFLDFTNGSFSYMDYKVSGIIGRVTYGVDILMNDGTLVRDVALQDAIIEDNKRLKMYGH